MRNKPLKATAFAPEKPYVMRIADLLSDDPMLIGLLGPNFKLIATYDPERRRATYSFRRVDDTDSDDEGANVT